MESVNLANNSTQVKRRDLDFYPTPENVTHALMQFLHKQDIIRPHAMIWEPACGDGAMSRVIESYGYTVASSDIREDCGYGRGGVDYLETPCDREYNGIITNPPFAQAADFIRKATSEAPLVAMLLKSQYWHAEKRTKLFLNFPPAWVLPLNWRPDFKAAENAENGKKGSPLMEVLWTVWIEGQTDTRYRILSKNGLEDTQPKEGGHGKDDIPDEQRN